jgi:hypothetical protein
MKPHNLPHTCVMSIGLLPVKGKSIFCSDDRNRTIIETMTPKTWVFSTSMVTRVYIHIVKVYWGVNFGM